MAWLGKAWQGDARRGAMGKSSCGATETIATAAMTCQRCGIGCINSACPLWELVFQRADWNARAPDPALVAAQEATKEAQNVAAERMADLSECAKQLFAAQEALAKMRYWLDNNTIRYDVDADYPVEGRNIPTLAQVCERIWYHASDDLVSDRFSAVIDAALSKHV